MQSSGQRLTRTSAFFPSPFYVKLRFGSNAGNFPTTGVCPDAGLASSRVASDKSASLSAGTGKAA